jgi:signal transduction histidine kinase
MQRVIGNLISNAIKHTPRDGRIVVKAKAGPKNGLTIAVEDNGEGIPQEYLETIFEKFSQVKGQGYRNTHNVGLGLTFCKIAVETHRGRIWVESKIDQGSTFYIWLPFTVAGA